MTTSLLLAFITILLALGFIAWRACVRAEKADWLLGAAGSELLRIDAMRASAKADLAMAESRAAWADLKVQSAHIRADCAETALRGELYRQTMSELTSDKAQEPVGRSNVIELPTGRAR